MGGGGARQITATYCKIPMKPLVQKTQQGSQKQATGIAIEGAMQRFNNMTAQCLLQLKVTNHTSEPLRDFVFKMNVNHFGFTVDEGVPQGFVVGPGCTAASSLTRTSGHSPQGRGVDVLVLISDSKWHARRLRLAPSWRLWRGL